MRGLTISSPFLHLPVSICLHEPDLPHPSHPTSRRVNVSRPLAKYIDLVHVSQSLVSARRRSISPSRKSHLRSIYLAFLLHPPQMTPFCSMVACDVHDRRSQQMRAKPRCSRAHLPVRKNSRLHSTPAHLISPFQAYPPM